MHKIFLFLGIYLVFSWPVSGQIGTVLEEDEGLGQYDYLCVTDSTWVHWSTDWAVWSTAEVSVTLPGATVDFPSEWKHDLGGRKHLSTIGQISHEHFPAASYQPG